MLRLGQVARRDPPSPCSARWQEPLLLGDSPAPRHADAMTLFRQSCITSDVDHASIMTPLPRPTPGAQAAEK